MWIFKISNGYRKGEIYLSKVDSRYDNIYVNDKHMNKYVKYCLDNEIILDKGDINIVEDGGSWHSTTYDQPDRWCPNLQPILTDEVKLVLEREIKLGELCING